MNIDGMVHVNINCTDYERSKAFYEMLGFEEVWQVPATNSPAVNAAVAMQNYRVTGAIMRLRGVEPAVLIDLLQWHQPEDHSPPYPNLHRPGLARLALRSSREQGTATISERWARGVWAGCAEVRAFDHRGQRTH